MRTKAEVLAEISKLQKQLQVLENLPILSEELAEEEVRNVKDAQSVIVELRQQPGAMKYDVARRALSVHYLAFFPACEEGDGDIEDDEEYDDNIPQAEGMILEIRKAPGASGRLATPPLFPLFRSNEDASNAVQAVTLERVVRAYKIFTGYPEEE